MIRIRPAAVHGLCLLLFSPPVAASDQDALQNNPFARPPSEVTAASAMRSRTDGRPVPLEVRATLVSQGLRLANISGKVLKPGETIDGYTLLSVHEDKTVFLRDGKKVTVYVKPDPVSEDENPRR